MTPSTTSLHAEMATLLIAALATLAVIAAVVSGIALASLWRGRARTLVLEAALAALRRELDVSVSECARVGGRTKRMEAVLGEITARIDSLEAQAAAPSQSFDRAIDSARRGAEPAHLTEQFGLSRGEADLVARLHGRKKSA
jgi:hypothetical protein